MKNPSVGTCPLCGDDLLLAPSKPMFYRGQRVQSTVRYGDYGTVTNETCIESLGMVGVQIETRDGQRLGGCWGPVENWEARS